MKKILIFSLVYYPRFVGGAEVAVKEITDRIPEGEVSFTMVTLRSRGEPRVEKVGNIQVFRIGPTFLPLALRKYLFPFLSARKAKHLHAQNRYDSVWSIMANYAGFGALFFKFKHPDVPFLLTLQEGDSLEHIRQRVGLLYPLFKKIFTKADRIQAISRFLSEWARYMGAKAHIYVVPNGVDIQNFQPTTNNQQREEQRKELGYKTDDKVIITTSRLVVKNGVGDLLEAMRYLPENVKLLVIGSGPLERALKLQTTNYKLQTRVQFLGYIPHDELPAYLHTSDVFVRPSLSEGLGISFLEAMAAGLPVVATPVGGIPDFLTDRETGLFCEPHNPKSIAEQVTLLLSDTALRNKVIANASALVREDYDWDFIAERMGEVFDRLRRA